MLLMITNDNLQARNVLNYLKIIYTILEDDGIWINLGEYGLIG